MIPLGVHIGSKGCKLRYMTAAGSPQARLQCGCPPDVCWVTYARAEHAAGRPAMEYKDWLKSLDPNRPVAATDDWQRTRGSVQSSTEGEASSTAPRSLTKKRTRKKGPR